jgi:hypothetical protein
VLKALEDYNKEYQKHQKVQQDLDHAKLTNSDPVEEYKNVLSFRQENLGLEHKLRAARIASYVSERRPLDDKMSAELYSVLSEHFADEDSEEEDELGFALCLDLFDL